MAKIKKGRPRRAVGRRLWTDQDLKRLRKMATREPARVIATALGRTHAAVTFKAHMEGISLRSKAKRQTARKAGRGSRK